MNKEQIAAEFGFDPKTIGLRHRQYWLVQNPDDEDVPDGVNVGDLCVRARDGASNPIDADACKLFNFITTVEEYFDRTYRLYYYRKAGLDPTKACIEACAGIDTAHLWPGAMGEMVEVIQKLHGAWSPKKGWLFSDVVKAHDDASAILAKLNGGA